MSTERIGDILCKVFAHADLATYCKDAQFLTKQVARGQLSQCLSLVSAMLSRRESLPPHGRDTNLFLVN